MMVGIRSAAADALPQEFSSCEKDSPGCVNRKIQPMLRLSPAATEKEGPEMSRKMAIKAASVAAALGAMTSVAWAESIKLTDAQMDQIAAGTSMSRLPPNPYKYTALGAHHPGGVDFGVTVLTRLRA